MARLLLPVLLLLFLTVSTAAQSISRHVVDRGTGEVVRSAEPGEIIIELATPPLALQSGKAAASAHVAALLDRLERDLSSIERAGVASKGADTRVVRHRYTHLFAGASAHVSPEAIERIRALDYVRAVHPDRVVTAYLQESVQQVGAPQFWQRRGVRGSGVVVAVLDSGIDYTHPAFGGGFGPGNKVLGGRDFINNDGDPMDDHGHGTHVAGIIAADGGGLTGVAPDASLLAYKVLDNAGSGRDSGILAALEEVARQHPDVVNMSLGRPAVADDPVVRAIETASGTGILFCVAAGNSGRFLDIGSPGNTPSAITVGAVDRTGRLAPFSTRGPVVPTGEIKPEIAAPGVSIVSARNGGGTRTASGTSMAAPHVAGVAALLRAAHPEWSFTRLRSAIINGARPLDAEVMAVGGGLVFAADDDDGIEPSSVTLSFGVSDQTQNPWTSTASISLTNRSSELQSLTVTADGLRDGIELTPSATSIELEPGATRSISFQLRLDHSKVPAAAAGSLSFGGFLRVAGNDASIAIPWSFVKASRARVRWNGSGAATVKLGTAAMMVSAATTTKNPTAELFVGAGPLTLWVEGDAPGTAYHIIRENLDLSATADVTVGPADAPHRIQFAGADAFGRLLADRGSRAMREMLISHPNFESNLLDALVTLNPSDQVYVSTLSPPARLLGFERAFDRDPAVTWVAQYPLLNEVTGNVTLTIPPEWWKELSADTVAPSGITDAYRSTFASFFVRTGRQTIGSIARPQDDSRATDVRAWLTAPPSADSGTSVIVEIGNSSPASTEVTAEFTAANGGIVEASQPGARLSSRVIPSGEPFTIGDGPAHPNANVAAMEGTMFATIAWAGPHGEQRLYDAKRMTAKLFDAKGTVIATGEPATSAPSIPGRPSPGFQMLAPLPSPGLYTLEASTASFDVAGSPARATLRVRFDSANTEDSSAPLLTSLRIQDGSGRTSARIAQRANATLSFSAIDLARFGLRDVRRDRTTVHTRAHGSGDDRWIAMTATVVGDDLNAGASPTLFRVPDGVLYRVDLDHPALQGAVDVRITVEDAAGNSTSYVVEPAFVIGSSRRRAARP
jgi:hypothetical protein